MDLVTIYVANLFGFALLCTVFACNTWRMRYRSRENGILMFLIIFSAVSCFADPIAYSFDGVPGLAGRLAEYASIMWLYAGNIIATSLWLVFIAEHVHYKFTKTHKTVLLALGGIAVVILVVNLFYPVAFSLDESNVYARENGYFVFSAVNIIFLIDSIVVYAHARVKGGVLKFFPVWVYVVPVLIGSGIQICCYGISMVWPCAAIAIAGILASLQNELMFRDKLTGLYNRFYLDNITDTLGRGKNLQIGAMMIDLNGFKAINDTLGHTVGDEALKDTARILKDVIGTAGSIMRYAGDEFVILINTSSQDVMSGYVAEIQRGFEEFGKQGEEKYDLSVSIGSGIFDLHMMSVDEMMNEIDARMYQAKREYYLAHDRRQS